MILESKGINAPTHCFHVALYYKRAHSGCSNQLRSAKLIHLLVDQKLTHPPNRRHYSDQSGLGEVSSEDIAALWASNADDGADDSTSMGGHQSVGPEPTAPAGGQNQFEDDEDLYRIDLDRMEPINGRQQQQPQQPAHANDIQDQEDGRPQVTSSLDLDGIIIGGESQEAAGLDGLIDNEVIGVGNNESSQSTTANEAGGKLDPSTTGLRVPIVNWNSSSLNNGADRRGGGGPVVWLHAHTNAPKVATTIDSTRQRLARFVHKIAPELGCFTGLGEHYRGNVSTSSDNRPCLNWLRVRLFRFHQVEADKGAAKGQAGPSLLSLALSPSDNHNYCRNPNMDPHGPWCFVAYSERLDGPQLAGQAHQQQQGRGHMMIASTRLGSSVKFVGRPCDVAPCSEYLWLYIVAPPLGLLVLLTCLVGVLVCSIRKSHYNAIFSAQQRACKGAKTGASSMGRLLMGSRGRFAPKKFGCSPAAKRNKTTNYLDDDIFEIVDDIDFCDGQTHSSSLSPKSSESLKLNSSANNHEPTTASEQVDAFCQQQKPKHSNLNHCKSVNPIFADRPLATGTSSKQHQHHHKQQLRSGGPMFATLRCHVRGTLQRVSQQQQQQQLVQDKSSSFIEQCDLATNNSSKFKLAACDWIAASPSSSSSSSSSSSAPAANSDKHIPNNTNETTKTSHLISCSSSSSTNAITSEPSAITAGRKSTTNFSENCILGTDLPHLNAYNISIAYDQQPIYEGKFSQVQAAFIKQQQDDTTQATGLIGAQVAVCSLKQQSTLDDSVFEPANLKLRNLNHLNILKLIGYAKFEDEIGLNKRSNACVLIYDMAHLIDLCDWLKEQNKDSIISNGDPANELSLRQNLTCFAKQIALALDYLHDRNIVYKDLACRNCFIDVTKMLVKLASFNIELEIDDTNGETNRNILNLKSMIRPKYLLDYYVIDSRPSECQLLPLSWIPLESILFNKFNKQTDVWSFGCLLYELFSLGEVAYFGYSSKQVIDSVRSNLMPPQALLCPNGVYKLMCKCLSDIPTLRPNVKQIYEELNLYSGQCSSFLDHHLCSLATAMCNQPKEEPLVGSAQQQHVAMRIQSTKGTGSITKTKSYANIGDYSPSAPPPPSSSGRFKSEQEQLFSSSNGNDIANQFNRTDASSQNRPETSVGKIPLSKSINLGASRLARPFVMPNSGKNAPSDDANQYDEPIIDIKKT